MQPLCRITIFTKCYMNPLILSEEESFRTGDTDLTYFYKRLVKMPNGVLLYCTDGEADITVDLKQYHIVPNTNIILLADSILSLRSAGRNLRLHFFAFSDEMFKISCFRLEPTFIHFLKENPCYTHSVPEILRFINGMIEASSSISYDSKNRFREHIARNLLQVFFLNTYDKVQRFFTKEQISGNNRKDQLFKKFISLVHAHCTTQRDVAFYAEQLCISTRYLAAITKEVSQQSAKEIIDSFLMLELKVALRSTNLSLKEIADHYHFPDQSFFGRYFKKHTGISPKQYRMK